ncbi:MAG: hypothetical protein ACK5IB_11640 [Qingshengfaniella sp.]
MPPALPLLLFAALAGCGMFGGRGGEGVPLSRNDMHQTCIDAATQAYAIPRTDVLVFEPRPSQSGFAAPGQAALRDGTVARFQCRFTGNGAYSGLSA